MILTEAIRMIHRRTNGICIQALHSYQSAFKELKVFGSDLLVLSSEACRSMLFLFITINNVAVSMFGSLKPILFAASEVYTSFCQDLECASS